MANSADPDQNAPKEQFDLGLHCLLKPGCSYILGQYDGDLINAKTAATNRNRKKKTFEWKFMYF